jgi:hypothetical protein
MPNLRIISDNAADRGVTTPSSVAGSFVAANLKNDKKSIVWRSAGDAVNLISKPSNFEDAAWSKTSCTVTANAAMAPDGSVTAELLSFTAANGTVAMDIAVSSGYMVGTQHTFSIWLWTLSGTSNIDLAVGDFNYQNLYSGSITINTTPTKYTFTTPITAWNSGNVHLTCQLRGYAISNIYAWSAELYKVPKASLSTTWNTPETIAAVALPFANLTPTASMRVRLSNEVAKTNANINNSQTIGAGTNMTVTQNAIAAPDGTISAGLHIPTAAAVVHELGQAGANYIAGQAYTVSFFTKLQAGSPFVGWNFAASSNIGSGGAGSARLDTLAVTGAGVLTATGINGWYRVSLSFTPTVTMSSNVFIRPIDAAGSSSAIGDGIKGIYLWGMQVELSTLSSYYPTTTGPAARPTGYIDNWQSYAYDTTALACPASRIALNGFTKLQAQSAYAYGGGACARAWFTPQAATGLKIDITDVGNEAGYVEASRLVIGNYWTPAYNSTYGGNLTLQDSSTHFKTQAGDLLTDIGTINPKLTISQSNMQASDRTKLQNILYANRMASPMFISLFPENADLELERDHQIYGKLSQQTAMTMSMFNAYSGNIEITEV